MDKGCHQMFVMEDRRSRSGSLMVELCDTKLTNHLGLCCDIHYSSSENVTESGDELIDIPDVNQNVSAD